MSSAKDGWQQRKSTDVQLDDPQIEKQSRWSRFLRLLLFAVQWYWWAVITPLDEEEEEYMKTYQF
jgi:hypothetical protein